LGESDARAVEPLRRRIAYVCGQWRVTYQHSGEPGRESDVRRGLLVGPLVSDPSSVLWGTVVPDGSTQRTMIRRDSITDVASPHRARRRQPSSAG
jgi:hypothetical protein